MADEIYEKLPKDLVEVIAHQEIRDDLLKSIAFWVSERNKDSQIDSIARNNLVAKCHSLIVEWLYSKNPKILPSIPYPEINGYAKKMAELALNTRNEGAASIFIQLNEMAYAFQQEIENKYVKR